MMPYYLQMIANTNIRATGKLTILDLMLSMWHGLFQFLDVDPGQREGPLGEGQPGKLKPALGTLLFPNALVRARQVLGGS